MDAYQALYCGLCHTLGRRYGFAGRMTLNYDFTFLAMLLSHGEHAPRVTRVRCAAHPFRPRNACAAGEGMELAADESIILAYQKLRDNVHDSGLWKGLPARIGAWFLRGAYRKARARVPEFDGAVTACLEQLAQLERENAPSLDQTADTFARILQVAVPERSSPTGRILAQLLYHTGRWIYLVDALDDLEADRAADRYNPIAARFGGEPDHDALRDTLRASRALCASAYELLESSPWSALIENIVYFGLPTVETLVFSGDWRAAQKRSWSVDR